MVFRPCLVMDRPGGLSYIYRGRQWEVYESARKASSLRRCAAIVSLSTVLAWHCAKSNVRATPLSPWSVDQ
jgi:hypothetical protein